MYILYIKLSYWVDSPEFIEGKVQPAEVGGVVHKQPVQCVAEALPEPEVVVVEEEGCAG